MLRLLPRVMNVYQFPEQVRNRLTYFGSVILYSYALVRVGLRSEFCQVVEYR